MRVCVRVGMWCVYVSVSMQLCVYVCVCMCVCVCAVARCSNAILTDATSVGLARTVYINRI